MKVRRTVLALAWAIAAAALSAGQVGGQSPPALPPGFETVALPPEVRVVPPGPDVPRELASFSGWWAGTNDGVLPHVLVVEVIVPERPPEPAGAVVVWARGDAPQWRVRRAWLRIWGRFSRGELHLAPGGGVQVIYRMRPDDTLDSTYEAPGIVSRATLRRLPSR